MCVIIAKHFKDTGWVLAKNRDQDYVSTISFKDRKSARVGEVFTLYDHDIKYQEGCNYKGLAVITTSLAPLYVPGDDGSDGDKIERAIGSFTDPEDAADYLIKQKLPGFIACVTPDKLVMVEAAKTDQGKGEYHAFKRVIPKTETVAVTNHGLHFDWAGFQYGYTENQDMWRKSSEMRLEQAQKVVKNAKNLDEMIDGLAGKNEKDLQMNIFRVENKPKQMRTIFQWGFDLKNHKVYIRPIQTKLSVDVTKELISCEVLDNEIIKKRFDGKLRHFTKYAVGDEDGHIKTVQTEQRMLKFGEFLQKKSGI